VFALSQQNGSTLGGQVRQWNTISVRYSAGAVQRKPQGPIVLLHLPEQGGVVGSDDDWELGGNRDDLEEWSDTTSNTVKNMTLVMSHCLRVQYLRAGSD
jgi:hypothetical protein